jgi:hypothetical protein
MPSCTIFPRYCQWKCRRSNERENAAGASVIDHDWRGILAYEKKEDFASECEC